MTRIVLVAGELSGDALGAGLIRQLKAAIPDLECFGIGGPKMIAEGLESWHALESLSVMGITAVLARLPKLMGIRRDIVLRSRKIRADLFIGIDAPDFNLGLAQRLNPLGIKTVQYVSPSIWAWRSGRLKTIQKSMDLVLTLFPFEQHLYQQANVMAVCVGHPLADQIALEQNVKAAREALGLNAVDSVVALLPGSRQSEILHNLPTQLSALAILLKSKPELRCLLPIARPALRSSIEHLLQNAAPEVGRAVELDTPGAEKVD